jgi:homoserine kinase type II
LVGRDEANRRQWSEGVKARDFYELYRATDQLSVDAQKLSAKVQWQFLEMQVREIVSEYYDLGEPTSVRQIFGGYVNLSFEVRTVKDGQEHKYFMRKYNAANTEKEIQFEHALLDHLTAHGFSISAAVIKNVRGSGYEEVPESADPADGTRFWAMYVYLEGEDKYTWVDNKLNDREYASAGALLAQFHHYAHDFDPHGLQREQPPILELVPTLTQTFRDCTAQATGTVYDQYLLPRLDDIIAVIDASTFSADELAQMPVQAVHCDFHPGNQKYAGDAAVGLFDFDWSKIDYRLFDVALGVAYFCSSWVGDENGQLWVPQMGIFLRAYQAEARKYDAPGPLNDTELRVFAKMLGCANLFLLNWDITAYYADKNPDDQEYLKYIRHNVKLMDFIKEHADEIAVAVASAAVTTV